MELQQLIHFQRVAQFNNMSRAAAELHITQPALSKSIAGLEEELGVKLFDRKGKKIVLNEIGEEVLAHTNRIEDECRMIRRIGREKQKSKELHLLVKAADQLIPDIVFRISEEHPEIRIIVNHYQAKNKPDIVISSSLQPYKGPNGLTVLKESFVLVVPAGHPLAKKDSVHLADLDGRALIVLSESIPLRNIVLYWLDKAGARVRFAYECDSCVMMREMINGGRGIGLVPSKTWSFPENDTIRVLPIEEDCYRYVEVMADPQKYEKETAFVYRTIVAYLEEFNKEVEN